MVGGRPSPILLAGGVIAAVLVVLLVVVLVLVGRSRKPAYIPPWPPVPWSVPPAPPPATSSVTMVRFCASCGEAAQVGARFCGRCGAPHPSPDPPTFENPGPPPGV